jgi:hypothetical protein
VDLPRFSSAAAADSISGCSLFYTLHLYAYIDLITAYAKKLPAAAIDFFAAGRAGTRTLHDTTVHALLLL